MGVTISSKNCSCDMGYFGFARLRCKVAELKNVEFGIHRSSLERTIPFGEDERKEFFEKYNAITTKMVNEGKVSAEIANFCYQSDCEGKIKRKRAAVIYKTIKDCDDKTLYGYTGRVDCATFEDLKNIFKDCVEHGGTVEWY